MTDKETNKEKRTKHLETLGSALSRITKPLIGKRGFVEVDMIIHWENIVGKELASSVKPKRIAFTKGQRNNGTLYVSVTSGGDALILQHKQNLVIEKVNSHFGYRAVDKIKIIQEDSVDNKDEKKQNKNSFPNKEPQKKPLPDLTEGIECEELKNALDSLMFTVNKNNN